MYGFRWALGVAFLFCEGVGSASHAQYDLNPRTITRLNEAIAGAKQDKQYRVDRSVYSNFAILSEKGLVILSADGRTIRALDHDNTVLWETTPMYRTNYYAGGKTRQVGTFGAFRPSLDGRYLLFSQLVLESSERIATVKIVIDTDYGRPRFMRFPEYRLRFSKSGDYLISGVYSIEGIWDSPVKVYEVETGETLWIHEVSAEEIAELGSGKVAYIHYADNKPLLTIAELTTGTRILTNSIEWLLPEGFKYGCRSWDLTTTVDGSKFLISVQDSCFDGPIPSFVHTVMFDGKGRPLWDDKKQLKKTGTSYWYNAKGFSPDGRFLMFQRIKSDEFRMGPDQLVMTNAETGDVLWTLNDDDFGLRLMTNNHIVLSHAYKPFILILNIDESGQLRDQARLDKRLVSTGLRIDSPVKSVKSSKRYRFSLLFSEVEQDSITYTVEYIPSMPF